MNAHQNARTNPCSRALLVARIEGGWTAAEAAASFGISVRTVRKWRARERAEGAAGLVNRSSRPFNPAGRMGAGWCRMILRLRHYRLTAAEIADRLRLARSTVAAELARLGLDQLAALEPKAPIRLGSFRDPGCWCWMVNASCHQGGDKFAEQGFAAAAGVMHELEETEIERQLLLRDAAMRP